MSRGDLITIAKSPWDKRLLFGYKNGDLAIILEVSPTPPTISLPSIKVFVFASEKTVTIPRMYATKLGD
tara:strand:+ start:657 stop:863 length:207 start_codon:yes stop_codon:yes gene_type:complete